MFFACFDVFDSPKSDEIKQTKFRNQLDRGGNKRFGCF